NDTVQGGGGADVFVLGSPDGDGRDQYTGGEGADLYWITGDFEQDVVLDFSLADGDRLVIDTGAQITMRRGATDKDDLELTFMDNDGKSVLVLDEFFTINPGFGALPLNGQFNASQIQTVLEQVQTPPDVLAEVRPLFEFADALTLLS